MIPKFVRPTQGRLSRPDSGPNEFVRLTQGRCCRPPARLPSSGKARLTGRRRRGHNLTFRGPRRPGLAGPSRRPLGCSSGHQPGRGLLAYFARWRRATLLVRSRGVRTRAPHRRAHGCRRLSLLLASLRQELDLVANQSPPGVQRQLHGFVVCPDSAAGSCCRTRSSECADRARRSRDGAKPAMQAASRPFRPFSRRARIFFGHEFLSRWRFFGTVI